MYKLLLLILLSFSATAQECETFEQKSTTSVLQQRQVQHMWWNEWETFHDYPVIYNYTVCTNSTLETAKQLEIKNGSRDNIKYILFRNSSIPIVPVGIFIPFTNVTELYLNSSEIEFIDPGAFSGMIKLEKLYLQDNKIETLERGTLNYLSTLKTLDLSRNRLTNIEDKALFGLLVLKKVNLKNNALVHQSFNEFATLQNLEVLDLSGNNLTYFSSKGVFKKLHTLFLNNNSLDSFNFDVFEKPTSCLKILDLSYNNLIEMDFSLLPENLESINISNNKISKVQNWKELRHIEKVDLRRNNIRVIDDSVGPGIKYLYLSWNNIEHLEPFLFNRVKSLIELDLSHNMLTVIDQELFSNFVYLQNLYLNDNKISVLGMGCFNNLATLKSLNLSHNFISNLEFGTFSGLDSLEELDISHNSFTFINENSFHVLENLERLFLDNNLITTINVPDLLEHLPNLKLITLQNNKWNCNNLFRIIKAFREKSINTSYRLEVPRTANVFGISCKNKENENIDYVPPEYKDLSTTTMKITNKYSNEKQEKLQYYDLPDEVDFKSSRFYTFFSELVNSSFYNFFNETFRNLTFIKYLNSKVFSGFFNYDIQELQSNEKSRRSAVVKNTNNRLDIFVEQNKDLIKHFQTLSNRIIGFITIMITILLVIILLFLFMFLKPNTTIQNKQNVNSEYYNVEFELQ